MTPEPISVVRVPSGKQFRSVLFRLWLSGHLQKTYYLEIKPFIEKAFALTFQEAIEMMVRTDDILPTALTVLKYA